MSQAPTATNLLTAEEFYEFVTRPENEGRSFELVRGEVVEDMSRAGHVHGVTCHNVDFALGTYLRQVKRGNVACNDTGLLLGREPDTVRGPDVAYFATTVKFNEFNPKWIEETPILAVEVWSPNDRPAKMNRKVADYLASGVKMVWLVDPEEQAVTVYRPGMSMETFDNKQHLDGGDVLPGFRCAVADFFFSVGDQPA